MATMMSVAHLLASRGPGVRCSIGSVVELKGRLGRSTGCAAASTACLPRQRGTAEDDRTIPCEGPRNWTERIWNSEAGGARLASAAAAACTSVGFHLQAASLAWAAEEAAAEVENSPEELTAFVLSVGFYAILYFLVIPLITYNYLRLRWYKRNAAETFFQFALVFVFFPGMLLLAPFINFRRLPKEGTEPP